MGIESLSSGLMNLPNYLISSAAWMCQSVLSGLWPAETSYDYLEAKETDARLLRHWQWLENFRLQIEAIEEGLSERTLMPIQLQQFLQAEISYLEAQIISPIEYERQYQKLAQRLNKKPISSQLTNLLREASARLKEVLLNQPGLALQYFYDDLHHFSAQLASGYECAGNVFDRLSYYESLIDSEIYDGVISILNDFCQQHHIDTSNNSILELHEVPFSAVLSLHKNMQPAYNQKIAVGFIVRSYKTSTVPIFGALLRFMLMTNNFLISFNTNSTVVAPACNLFFLNLAGVSSATLIEPYVRQTVEDQVVDIDSAIFLNLSSDVFFGFNEISPSFVKTITINEVDYGRSIIKSGNKLIVAGSTKVIGGNWDIFLAELAINIEPVWTKRISGDNDDFAHEVIELDNNRYAVAGWTESYGGTDTDFLVIVFDALGKLCWSKTIGGNAKDFGRSITKLVDGNMVLCGETNSFGSGLYDFLCVKLSAEGDLIWSKTIGGNNIDTEPFLTHSNDGGFLISGYSKSFQDSGVENVFVCKLQPNGEIIWSVYIDSPSNSMQGRKIIESSFGKYAITGLYYDTLEESFDLFIAQFNGAGALEWIGTLGGDSDDAGRSLIETSDSGYVAVGWTDSFGIGSRNVMAVKISSNSTLLWTSILENSNYGAVYEVIELNDQTLQFVGEQSNNGPGLEEFLFVRVREDGTGCVNINNDAGFSIVSLESKNTMISEQPASPTMFEVTNQTSLSHISIAEATYCVTPEDFDTTRSGVSFAAIIPEPVSEWLSYDNTTGTIKGVPPADSQGKYLIKVVAYDGYGKNATLSFNLIINNPEITVFGTDFSTTFIDITDTLDVDSIATTSHEKPAEGGRRHTGGVSNASVLIIDFKIFIILLAIGVVGVGTSCCAGGVVLILLTRRRRQNRLTQRRDSIELTTGNSSRSSQVDLLTSRERQRSFSPIHPSPAEIKPSGASERVVISSDDYGHLPVNRGASKKRDAVASVNYDHLPSLPTIGPSTKAEYSDMPSPKGNPNRVLEMKNGIRVEVLKDREPLGQGKAGKAVLARQLDAEKLMVVKKVSDPREFEAEIATVDPNPTDERINRPFTYCKASGRKHGKETGKEKLYLLSDYAGISSVDYLAKFRGQEETRIVMLTRLAHRLIHIISDLHTKQREYHLDLKPPNITIDAIGHPKLIDFSCKIKSETGMIKGRGGDSRYYSPQCFDFARAVMRDYFDGRVVSGEGVPFLDANKQPIYVGEVHYNKEYLQAAQEDIWALGLSLLEFYLGRYPFSDATDLKNYPARIANASPGYLNDLLQRIYRQDSFLRTSNCALVRVMKGFLTVDEGVRMSFSEASDLLEQEKPIEDYGMFSVFNFTNTNLLAQDDTDKLEDEDDEVLVRQPT